MELSPRLLELSGKAMVGIATDEELLELKELKKETRKEIKVVRKNDPEFLIKNIEKRIHKLQGLIDYIRENGKLPEKEVVENEDGTTKRRGRPKKEDIVVE